MDQASADIQRGIQADALLQNELFRDVLNQLDGLYTAAWREAKTPEAREDCFRYVKLVERLVQDITTISTTGKLAQARIRELERGKRGMTWPTNWNL